MVNEWLMIIAITWSTALFAIGGTNGKFWRRYVLPAGLAGISLLYAPWWACVGYGLTTSAVLHLGYGDRCSWLKRAFIFIGYGITSLWFGVSWWLIVVPVGCSAMFLLSNWSPTEKSFTWKICEAGMGFLIACAFVASLTK